MRRYYAAVALACLSPAPAMAAGQGGPQTSPFDSPTNAIEPVSDGALAQIAGMYGVSTTLSRIVDDSLYEARNMGRSSAVIVENWFADANVQLIASELTRQ